MRAAILFLFLLLAAAGPAVADDLSAARAEFARGEALFAERDFAAAAIAYRRSFELSDRPGLLFNIAQALRLAGDLEGAIDQYRAFLDRTPDHELAPLARLHLDAVLRTIAEAEPPPAPEPPPPSPDPPVRQAPVSSPVASVATRLDRDDSPVPVGAFARLAVDASTGDRAFLLGGAVELGRRIELSLAAILGAVNGAYGGAALYLARGAVRPHLAAGVPIFFHGGAHPGVRGAAGLSLMLGRHIAFSGELGVERYLSAPDGFERTLLVPALTLRANR